MTEPTITHKPLDEYVINTHTLHNGHLLQKAIPRALISPIPLFPRDQHQSEHARAATGWQLNPRSYTTQEQVRQAKKEAAEKEKKGKHRKKRMVDEAFADEMDTKPQDPEDKMVLISDLGGAPLFLSRPVEDKSTTRTPAVL